MIQGRAAISMKFTADVPTITMSRLKALITVGNRAQGREEERMGYKKRPSLIEWLGRRAQSVQSTQGRTITHQSSHHSGTSIILQ